MSREPLADRGGAWGDLRLQALEELTEAGAGGDCVANALGARCEVAGRRDSQSRPEGELGASRRRGGGARVERGRLGGASLAREGVRAVGKRVGVVEVDQAAQLAERVGRVLDAELGGRAPWLALGGDDQERRGLAPADVAAGGLAGVERGEQPAIEGSFRALNAAAIAGQTSAEAIMFAWALNPSPWTLAGGRDAAVARVNGDPPLAVDHGDLAKARERIGGKLLGERCRWLLACAKALEKPRAVGRLGDRLGRDRADPGAGPGDDRADRKPVRLDGDAQVARRRVTSDDRVSACAGEPFMARAGT